MFPLADDPQSFLPRRKDFDDLVPAFLPSANADAVPQEINEKQVRPVIQRRCRDTHFERIGMQTDHFRRSGVRLNVKLYAKNVPNRIQVVPGSHCGQLGLTHTAYQRALRPSHHI